MSFRMDLFELGLQQLGGLLEAGDPFFQSGVSVSELYLAPLRARVPIQASYRAAQRSVPTFHAAKARTSFLDIHRVTADALWIATHSTWACALLAREGDRTLWTS